MILTGFHMLTLVPRHALLKLFGVALAAVVLMASLAAPASAKQAPKVKKIKKELVTLQERLDDQIRSLDRLGKSWDRIEARSDTTATNLLDFVTRTLDEARQARIETLILQVRADLDRLETKRDRTITKLERIVLERQERKLEKSGVAPATVAPIKLGGSLVTYSADWEETAMCESTKRWHIDSRYDGGLQFDPITWIEFGGAEFARYAYEATKMEQIAVAERVLAIQGPGAWPNCFHPLQADS